MTPHQIYTSVKTEKLLIRRIDASQYAVSNLQNRNLFSESKKTTGTSPTRLIKEFENEFLAIVYNDALTSKSDFLSKPTISIQHINEFNLKDEISLSECDDSKSDKDNDDDKIDIKQSSGGNVINTNVGSYAEGSNKLLETSHDTSNKDSQIKVLVPTIDESEGMDEPIIEDIETKFDNIGDDEDKLLVGRQPEIAVYTAYSLNEYSVFDIGINTAYPGEWIRRIDFLYSLGPREGKSTNVGENLQI
ncbi:hypothetical protein Tco_0025564 [Tanacetum coccineum]